MIVPGDHPITLSNNSRYHSHTSNTCLKRLQITRFTHYYIATWRNHSEQQQPKQHQVERQRMSTPSSQPNLSVGTRPQILSIVSLVVVLGLKTYQTIMSMICTGHRLPPHALRLLCGSGMQG